MFRQRKVLFFLMSLSILPGCIGDQSSQKEYSNTQTTQAEVPFDLNYHANCSFCRIVAGKDPAQVITETEDLVVIEKRPVRSPVDCLIIPKKHIVNIKTLDQSNAYDEAIGSKMMFMAQKLSQRLEGNQDFSVFMNNGASSAQSVFHMHMHFRSPYNWK